MTDYVRELDGGSAPGVDGITPDISQDNFDYLKPLFLTLGRKPTLTRTRTGLYQAIARPDCFDKNGLSVYVNKTKHLNACCSSPYISTDIVLSM
ncbi:hypothetical protein J6590_052634 [Homalodisca vitripennis]|nr:hypothetical protein J6590_052634 [Homalodisca vitripennis]